jgi:hypothetical protein
MTEEEATLIAASLAQDAEGESAPTTASAPRSGVLAFLDIALILDVAAAWYSDEDSASLGAHDPSRTGFTLQQLEMAIGANIDPFLRLDANLVFSEFGVELEEAYATTTALPGRLQFRAGQFLTAFGRANPTHPHSWRFANQTLMVGKFFGGEASRGVGIEASWLTPLPWYVELTGSATDAGGECCARSFFGANDLGVRGPADLLYTTRLEQFWSLSSNWSLLWGLSAQFGPNASGNGNRSEIYGSDLLLRYRPLASTQRSALSLQLEGAFRSRQVPDDVLQDGGGYAELAWTVSPRWETGVRAEMVSGLESDPLDSDWISTRRRLAVQGTFYPSHFSRVRLQIQHDHMAWRPQAVLGAIVSLEVLAGAHGSHEY